MVLASLNPSLNGYSPERTRALYDEFLARVRALPGVQSAALATGVVLSGGWDAITVNVENYQPREGEDMNPYSNLVSPGYFATMQMPIVAGRDFNEHDNLQSGNVGIINQSMAQYFSAIAIRSGKNSEPIPAPRPTLRSSAWLGMPNT